MSEQEIKNKLTKQYFKFILDFFAKYEIDKSIFFKGVCARWGIRKSDSYSDAHRKLEKFYYNLADQPSRFIDFAITWLDTPNTSQYGWYELFKKFQNEYSSWKGTKT